MWVYVRRDPLRSRKHILEGLGGKMSMLPVCVKAVGLVMRSAFKVKHMKKISTK